MRFRYSKREEIDMLFVYLAKKGECVSLSLQELVHFYHINLIYTKKLTFMYQLLTFVALTKILSFKRKREELLKHCLLNVNIHETSLPIDN